MVYSISVQTLISYYRLIGEQVDDCKMLDDFLGRYDSEKAHAVIESLFSSHMFQCMKSTNIVEKKSLLKFLSDSQIGELKIYYLRQLLERKKSVYFLSQTGLYKDNEILELVDKLNNECYLLQEHNKIQKVVVDDEFPVPLDPNLIPAKCFINHVINNVEIVKRFPEIKLLSGKVFFISFQIG